jgi:hypothetical protein
MEAQGSSTDGTQYTTAQALVWLRGQQPDFSLDQLRRAAEAVLPLEPCTGRVRFYSAADLELILISNRLQTETRMRYDNLTLLILDAQSEGRNVTEWFQKLIDRSRSKHRSFALPKQLTA